MKINKLEQIAKTLRKEILTMSYRANKAHISSCLCIVEILTYLYWQQMRLKPKSPNWEKRDKFLLSKGHAAPALYTTLAYKGFFPKKVLEEFGKDNSKLGVHPEFGTLAGIEISSGSLGHGLSIGAGMAIAAKINKMPNKIYVLISDAELNEGKIWEALLFAGQHKLNNLFLLVDLNGFQALGRTDTIIDTSPLKQKLLNFSWNAYEIDGNDLRQIDGLFKKINHQKSQKPVAIILKTVAGKGISFIENKLEWHYKNLDEKLYKQALEELKK